MSRMVDMLLNDSCAGLCRLTSRAGRCFTAVLLVEQHLLLKGSPAPDQRINESQNKQVYAGVIALHCPEP
eukprot:4460060-Amphidinium_carterae.1